jgi:hypothetical protein
MKSSSQADGVLDDDSDSQLLKLGWAALKKINSQDPAEQTPSIRRTMSDPVLSPDPKRPFQLVVSLMLNLMGGWDQGHTGRDIKVLSYGCRQEPLVEIVAINS